MVNEAFVEVGEPVMRLAGSLLVLDKGQFCAEHKEVQTSYNDSPWLQNSGTVPMFTFTSLIQRCRR